MNKRRVYDDNKMMMLSDNFDAKFPPQLTSVHK